jgi:hypothetical protein
VSCRGEQLLTLRKVERLPHLAGRLPLQARCVCEETSRGKGPADRHLRNVALERIVELEPAFFSSEQNRRSGERLRDRADAVLRVGIRRTAVVVGATARVRPHDLLAPVDGSRDAR